MRKERVTPPCVIKHDHASFQSILCVASDPTLFLGGLPGVMIRCTYPEISLITSDKVYPKAQCIVLYPRQEKACPHFLSSFLEGKVGTVGVGQTEKHS